MAIINHGDEAEALNVQWQITNACNYACPSCVAIDRTDNCVYMRERIMAMARKLVLKPRPLYNITLAGGEPALHPFTRDIIAYFFNSGRNVNITLETNGSQSLEWYLGLSEKSPRSWLKISVNIHPQYARPENIMLLLAQLSEAGHPVHARLHSGDCQKAAFWRNAFKKLAAIIGLTYDSVRAGTGANSSGQVLRHPQATGDGQLDPSWEEAGRGDEVFCCQGVNYLELLADGHFKGAACANAQISAEPLWRDGADIDSVLAIHRPGEECRNCHDSWLPRTNSLAAAEQIIESYAARQQYWAYEIGPLMCEEPSQSDLIRARMRRLRPLATNAEIIIEKFQIWRYWPRIVETYNNFATEESRKNFLTVIKALETGDKAYLGESPGSGLVRINPAWAEKLPACLKINTPAPLVELQSYADAISIAHPDLEIALPFEADQFLSELSWLGSFPGYSLDLQVRAGSPVLYASHPERVGIHPLLRPGAKSPTRDISIMIVTGNDQDTLEDTLNSVLMQDGVNLEIVVTDNASDDATADIIRRFIGFAPDVIKYFRCDKSRSAGALLNEALRHVQGESVVFLRAGDVLNPGILPKALRALRDRQVELVACGTAETENGLEWHTALDPACADEIAPENQWLQAWAAGYNLSGLLLDAVFLASNSILARDPGEFGALALGFDIFSTHPRYISLPEIGVKRPVSLCRMQALPELANILKYAKNLQNSGKIPDFSILKGLLNRIATVSYGVIANPAKDAIQSPPAVMNNNADVLAEWPPYLEKLLADYLETNAGLYKGKVASSSRRFSKFTPSKQSITEYWPLGSSPVASAGEPDFSLIIASLNIDSSYPEYIKNLLKQSLRNLEVLVIADSISETVWEELADIAEFDYRLRLYTTGISGHPGEHINLGIDKARGKYLMFLNPDTLPGEEFLFQVLSAAPTMDILLHSRRDNVAHARIKTGIYKSVTKEDIASIGSNWADYNLACKGALYNAKFLKETSFFRDRKNIDGLHALFRTAIANSRSMGCRATVAIEIQDTVSDSLEQIDLCLQYYEFVKMAGNGADTQAIEFHVERFFFPYLEAGRNLLGRLPLSDEDLALMTKNSLFLAALRNIIARRPARAVRLNTVKYSFIAGGGRATVHNVNFSYARRSQEQVNLASQSGCLAFTVGDRGLDDREVRSARARMNQNEAIDSVWFVRPSGQQEMPEPGICEGADLLSLVAAKEFVLPHLTDFLFRTDRFALVTLTDGAPMAAFLFKAIASASKIMILQGDAKQPGKYGSAPEFWRELSKTAASLAAFVKGRPRLAPVAARWLARIIYDAPEEIGYGYFTRTFKSLLEQIRKENILAEAILICIDWLSESDRDEMKEIRALIGSVRNG